MPKFAPFFEETSSASSRSAHSRIVEPGDLKVLLGHRPVVNLQLAVSNPDRLGLCNWAEYVPVEARAAGVHLFTPGRHRGCGT
jgi:hypothetical protein